MGVGVGVSKTGTAKGTRLIQGLYMNMDKGEIV